MSGESVASLFLSAPGDVKLQLEKQQDNAGYPTPAGTGCPRCLQQAGGSQDHRRLRRERREASADPGPKLELSALKALRWLLGRLRLQAEGPGIGLLPQAPSGSHRKAQPTSHRQGGRESKIREDRIGCCKLTLKD